MSRMFVRVFAVVVVCWIAANLGCGKRAESITHGPMPAITECNQLSAIDESLERAARFLAAQQSPDGCWRSNVYAPFKHGDSLTPIVLTALSTLPEDWQPTDVVDRGSAYLRTLVGPDGQISPPRSGIAYPVYTAAGALLALGDQTDLESQRARQAWVEYLCARQLNESNGWEPDNAFFGGWGYAAELPTKPPADVPVGPLTEPNLSATAFAVTGLRAAGVDPRAAVFRQALHFVRGCQNFGNDAPAENVSAGNDFDDNDFDDGGFFFVQSDAVRNKAGVRGTEATGRERFHSYGSATADGLLAYAACGVPASDARVRAAWQWLFENFSAEQHPGEYAPGRQAERDSVYYYYCHRLAEALHAYDDGLPLDIDRENWADRIAAALIERQHSDGSWVNPEVEVRENDPLVATALGTRALAVCRRLLVVESESARGALPHDDRPKLKDSPAHPSR